MGDHRRRQERWLHARISEELEGALKREARRRRLPVSLVVRDVLESALDLVEDIVESGMQVARRSQELARSATGRGPRVREAPRDVYGWQEIVLNRAADCSGCGEPLAAGAKANRGLRERAGRPVFLCAPCLRELRSPRPDAADEVEESA
ncbi:MAG TPA: hypothetical protein VFD92_10295 [Candidatus Binatia bacterium]|nr:hypothetical protein [Candidatus Binatia bacterium]